MYPYKQEIDIIKKTKIAIVILKICICIGLFFLGTHVTLWTIDILNKIINHPDDVALINKFINLQISEQVVDIIINNQNILFREHGIIKLMILIFIFIVLFNVIGRIISGIFSSIASILANFDIDVLKSDEKYK